MKSIINVKGMHCSSCSNRIEQELTGMKGVRSASVDLVKNNVVVEHDSAVSEDNLKDGVRKAGYSVPGDASIKNSFWKGLAYGIIPHIGCIAFLLAAVLGASVLMSVFKPLLMNKYIFHILVGISLAFATISSAFYLRKNKLLHWQGIKRKKTYLATMYGLTIGINLLLFLVIFPMAASASAPSITGDVIAAQDTSLVSMTVKIPCPGHAPLITTELQSIEGVEGIDYSFPNKFDVAYDSSITSLDAILALEVFDEYPATVTDESFSSVESTNEVTDDVVVQSSGATCGISSGGCGGSSSGGSSSGGCGGCGGSGGGSCGGSSSGGCDGSCGG